MTDIIMNNAILLKTHLFDFMHLISRACVYNFYLYTGFWNKASNIFLWYLTCRACELSFKIKNQINTKVLIEKLNWHQATSWPYDKIIVELNRAPMKANQVDCDRRGIWT